MAIANYLVTIATTAALLGALVASANAAESGLYEGKIRVRGNIVSIGARDLRLRSDTECRDHRNVRTTCATLAQIGYVDKARVLVSSGVVTHIRVLQLEQ